MNKDHIIIAYYNENLDWINKLDKKLFNIFIYNKSGKELKGFNHCFIIDLLNIGRESHTYLYHIINNYKKLPEYCIFLQGDPFPHSNKNLINQINNKTYKYNKFTYYSADKLSMRFENEFLIEEGMLHQKKKFKPWKNKHGTDSLVLSTIFALFPDIKENKELFFTFFGSGALFSCNKKLILNKDLEFYNKCINILEKSIDQTNPGEGHGFERIWFYLFNN